MNIKLKDMIIIAIIAVASFPLMYLTMLFATGTARIEINQKKEDAKPDKSTEQMNRSHKSDSMELTQSKTFLAISKQREDVAKEKEELAAQQERVALAQSEFEKQREEIIRERKSIEQLVSQSTDLDKKRIQQLAKVYASMRPPEAARILETLDDKLCVAILSNMGDDRQKAKIMTALSSEKASSLSMKMGR